MLQHYRSIDFAWMILCNNSMLAITVFHVRMAPSFGYTLRQELSCSILLAFSVPLLQMFWMVSGEHTYG